MPLTKAKIGSLITPFICKNSSGENLPIFGLNIDKEFMPTHADIDNVDISKYKIVNPGEFAFSGMQTGRDDCIRIGFLDGKEPVLISPAYITFRVTSELILPTYFFMIFRSSEMDRYGSFLSDSSIRSNLDWDRFCDIELELPSLDVQRKYVVIYQSLLSNAQSYESKLEDLRIACGACLEEALKDFPSTLEGCLFAKGEKNSDGQAKMEMGISISKVFFPTLARSSNIRGQKKVRPGQFAFVPVTSRNGDKLSIALNQSDDCYAVSSSYEVFETAPTVNPKYLYIWLTRPSFDRFARFNSWGSVRETISLEEISRYKIGLPPRERQDAIVAIYEAYERRLGFVKRLNRVLKEVCPILVRGAIRESLGEHRSGYVCIQ